VLRLYLSLPRRTASPTPITPRSRMAPGRPAASTAPRAARSAPRARTAAGNGGSRTERVHRLAGPASGFRPGDGGPFALGVLTERGRARHLPDCCAAREHQRRIE
jgi:hypothetical protein